MDTKDWVTKSRVVDEETGEVVLSANGVEVVAEDYSGIGLEKLQLMAQDADRAVKRRNAILADMRMTIWRDEEYLRLLCIADELDLQVALRGREEEVGS